LKKAKQLSQQIFDGIDPREQIKSDTMNMQLGEALKIYYQNDLTETNQHETNTIKSVKATFGSWVFRNTYDKKILELVGRVEDLQYKKLSSITPKMFKNLFQVCGSKSPITANRLQEYLRKFWNDFVKEEDYPFILKKKFKHDEKIYLDFLDPTDLKRVMKNAIVLDDRTGKFNMSHYFGHDRLSVVSCAMIAFLLTTGRRPDEVNKLRWDQYIPGEQPRISLDKTKSSKKNKKLTFRLGKEVVRILQIIQKDRLNNLNSKFYYSIEDEIGDFFNDNYYEKPK
jgi:integrase